MHLWFGKKNEYSVLCPENHAFPNYYVSSQNGHMPRCLFSFPYINRELLKHMFVLFCFIILNRFFEVFKHTAVPRILANFFSPNVACVESFWVVADAISIETKVLHFDLCCRPHCPAGGTKKSSRHLKCNTRISRLLGTEINCPFPPTDKSKCFFVCFDYSFLKDR